MSEQPDIEPLPFSVLYQQGLYQSLRSTVRSQLASIRRLLPTGDERLDDAIRQVVEAEREFLPRLEPVRRTAMAGRRTRLHGDYRLDEVRLVDDRFVLPDLSGDHRLAMSQRRLRASPLRDVADMLRSLDYVATDLARRADEKARGWAPWWSHIIGARFVNTYLTRMEHSLLLPADPEAVAALLDAYTLARSLRELHWELQVRPDWIAVPLAALRRALGHAPALLT